MPPPRVTIPELPLKSEPEGTDFVVIQDEGGTKRATVASVQGDAVADLDAHINDATDAHAASAIGATDSGNGIDGPTVQGQLGQLASAVDGVSATASGAASAISDHIADTSDAHDASAISATDSGFGINGPTVQGQLGQLATAVVSTANSLGTAISLHTNDTTDAHDASAVSFDPAGTDLSAIDVQAAIAELDTNVNSIDVSGFAEVYVHDGSDYILSGGRIFVGPEDPQNDGFVLNDGDQWLETD